MLVPNTYGIITVAEAEKLLKAFDKLVPSRTKYKKFQELGILEIYNDLDNIVCSGKQWEELRYRD